MHIAKTLPTGITCLLAASLGCVESSPYASATQSVIAGGCPDIQWIAGGGALGNPMYTDSPDISLSDDGRFIAFSSLDSNLVAGDINGEEDVFVYDVDNGTFERISVGGNGPSHGASLSADGRYVAFSSHANNFVPSDTNGQSDVFVYDRQAGLTTRVSVDTGGAQGTYWSSDPAISADGRFVVFTSHNAFGGENPDYAVDAFVHDRQTGQTTHVSIEADGTPVAPSVRDVTISGDGRYAAFTVPRSCAGNWTELLIHDLQTGQTIDPNPSGCPTSVEDVDPQTATTYGLRHHRIGGQGAYFAYDDAIFNNGLLTRFAIMVDDLGSSTTLEASVNAAGEPGNIHSRYPSISEDGRLVAFWSNALNLVSSPPSGHNLYLAYNPHYICNPDCGNGVIDAAEQCDDGNTTNGDGCSASCQFEVCGDGVVNNNGTEQCDDGNVQDGDGCDALCVIEFCGDGLINNGGSEQCDDGNNQDGDGCSNDCQVESEPGTVIEPWRENEMGTLSTGLGWDYAMGYHFTPQVDGNIVALGGFFSGTKTVRLFDRATGAQLAESVITSNNAWRYSTMAPIVVRAGTTYTVAVYLDGSGGSYRHNLGFSFPQTFGDVRIEGSTYAYTGFNPDNIPTNTITSVMYGQVDVRFESGVASPPSGNAVYDAQLGAPLCTAVSNMCDIFSRTTIRFRGGNPIVQGP